MLNSSDLKCLNKEDSCKCDYYLPSYITFSPASSETGEKYFYMDPNSVTKRWIPTNTLRDAEKSSGRKKKHWILCPLYYRDEKAGKKPAGNKYIPRDDTNALRQYLREFYPGEIFLNNGENIDTIDKIWVYQDGYYSSQQDKEKKNLERKCTNGISCPGLKDGTCKFNHYVDFYGVSSYPCPNDIDENGNMRPTSICRKINCPYDHSCSRSHFLDLIPDSYKNKYKDINEIPKDACDNILHGLYNKVLINMVCNSNDGNNTDRDPVNESMEMDSESISSEEDSLDDKLWVNDWGSNNYESDIDFTDDEGSENENLKMHFYEKMQSQTPIAHKKLFWNDVHSFPIS